MKNAITPFPKPKALHPLIDIQIDNQIPNKTSHIQFYTKQGQNSENCFISLFTVNPRLATEVYITL